MTGVQTCALPIYRISQSLVAKTVHFKRSLKARKIAVAQIALLFYLFRDFTFTLHVKPYRSVNSDDEGDARYVLYVLQGLTKGKGVLPLFLQTRFHEMFRSFA